ncbi:rod shape-determining protein MreC [Bacteroidia bacterium]|nr:rod shape-determining protein MreC [Bacteroidia bacterium]
MHRLLAFIEQNLYFILFAVLQVVCSFLLFGLNPYQQASFTHSAAVVTANSNKLSSDVTGYLDLKNQNIILQNQVANQFQNSSLGTIMYLHDTLKVKDSSRQHLYDLVPAQVVYNSVYKAENVFVINKGTIDGIKKNMGVVSSEGLAGIVLKSNAKYSTVMSLLNTNMKVIPNINGMEYFTELVWDNSSPQTMKIKGINKLEKIEVGDMVQTGQSSLLFPRGIPIGTITKLEQKENSQYFDTELVTTTNFRNLTYVYVVINRDAHLIAPLIEE